jgi:REP element-mobilizing transposase RayT
MPHHQLTGDLAEGLSEWVGQLCMAYGWRLEHLSVSPETLQWIIRAAPTVSPAVLMETLRQQTSERIFDHFPKIRQENPSGDFWAPGYLIMTQIDSVSDAVIQNFIHQIRQYQGASITYSSRLRR